MTELDYEKKVSAIKEKESCSWFKPRLNYSLKDLKGVRGKVLDIGCGAGGVIGFLAQKRPDLEIYGVDISQKALEIGRKDFPQIRFSLAPAEKLPFKTGFFDACLLICVLEHLKEPEKALTEIKRVLKAGGLFYGVVPLENDNLVLRPPARLARKFHGHLQRFSRQEIFSLWPKTGFKIKNFYYRGFLLNQIIGIGYLYFLEIFNFPAEFSIKNYLYYQAEKEKNQGFKTSFARKKQDLKILGSLFLRKLASFLINLESWLVPKKIPGGKIFITAVPVKQKTG